MFAESKSNGWVVGVLLLTLLSGCATHEQRVKTQGTAGGAAIGALLGYVVGGDEGAAWGAALGAGTGYAVGSYVAGRQRQYATREQMIEGETKHTEQLVAEVQGINAGLEREIAALNEEIRALRVKVARGTATRNERDRLRAKARSRLDSARKSLVMVQKERDAALAVLEGERRKGGGDARRLAIWQAKVDQLAREYDTLKKYVGELAALDAVVP
jgi:hypothetical protein